MGEREGERKAGDRGHSQVKWALTDMTVEVNKLKSECEKWKARYRGNSQVKWALNVTWM